MKEENLESNDWIEVLRAIRKMHPFVIVFTVAMSFFFGVVVRSDMILASKLAIIGAAILLNVLAVAFEAYRIDQEEKQRMSVFR